MQAENGVKPGSESKPSGFLRAFDSDPEFYGSAAESAAWAVLQACHGLLRTYLMGCGEYAKKHATLR
jgi:hypothetical protein